LSGATLGLVAGAPREERALGAVGDHTFTHPLLTGLAPADAEREIVRTQAAVARSSGGPVFLFRPPYGARNATIDGIVRAHGLLQILWTVDSADSLGANYARGSNTNVIAGLRPGAIILMHENHGQTVRAMISIFAALARKPPARGERAAAAHRRSPKHGAGARRRQRLRAAPRASPSAAGSGAYSYSVTVASTT